MKEYKSTLRTLLSSIDPTELAKHYVNTYPPEEENLSKEDAISCVLKMHHTLINLPKTEIQPYSHLTMEREVEQGIDPYFHIRLKNANIIPLDPSKSSYTDEEQEQAVDLFGTDFVSWELMIDLPFLLDEHSCKLKDTSLLSFLTNIIYDFSFYGWSNFNSRSTSKNIEEFEKKISQID